LDVSVWWWQWIVDLLKQLKLICLAVVLPVSFLCCIIYSGTFTFIVALESF
jgi:hypothetical protein